ncbi:glycogen debranching protein, partial [Streptomyces sp. NPDC055134]
MPHGPSFPLTDIPFSTQGSWLSLSPVISQHETSDDVHLISHVGGMHPVLSLQAYAGPHPAPVQTHSTPTTLTLQHEQDEQHRIEAVFQHGDTVRLRGRGLDLRIAAAEPDLTPFTGTYFFTDPSDGSHVFTSYETGRRYRVSVIVGTAQIAGDQALGPAARAVTIGPCDAAASWEIAIEELTAARPSYQSPGYHENVAAQAHVRFNDYTSSHIPWATPATPAAELAAYVMWSASVAPAGFLARPAVLMSKHWMNKVWSWDHCFNALALAAGDPHIAL